MPQPPRRRAEASSHSIVSDQRYSVEELHHLFAPISVAVTGASKREGRPGNSVLRALRAMGSELAIYPITPRYEEIEGLACCASLADAPGTDLVIVASGVERIESDFVAAIEKGAKAAVIFGAPDVHQERSSWLERIGDIADAARVPVLGPDTLGFANFQDRVSATWALPTVAPVGGIAVISQSGTTYWEANTNDPRLRFSFTAHGGLEATLTMADLVRYSLDRPATRVVGLYIETVRDIDGFVESLELASERGVPVVALFAGRSEASRAQMMTHAGRLAGDGAALEGLFRRYGVIRAESPDDWWTTLALLGGERSLGAGGLAAVMDSGGGLAMFHDFAQEFAVPLAQLAPATSTRLGEMLDIAPPTVGALDFWIGSSDRHSSTADLLTVLAEDPGTAAVMAFTTYAENPEAKFAINVADAVRRAQRESSTPVLAVTYTARQLNPALMLELADEGVSQLDGMRSAVLAMRHAFDARDYFARRSSTRPSPLDEVALTAARNALDSRTSLMEADALAWLGSLGVSVVPTRRAASLVEAVAAARDVGYPVVVKTDEGIIHKAERGGVRLHLLDDESVARAYEEMAHSLGPRVVVAPMLSGLEIALGVVASDYGPLLMVSAGGTMIELLGDRAYALAPVDVDQVAELLDGLSMWRVAERSLSPEARRRFCELVSRVSVIAYETRHDIKELDINPVLVSESACVAIDALIGTTREE